MRYSSMFIGLMLVTLSAGAQTLEEGIKAHQEGNLKAAEKIFSAVTARRPGDVAALVWLGRTLVQQGRAKEAQKPLETAIGIAPKNAEAHFRLGESYGVQAREANVLSQASLARKVRLQFEKAVELDPDHLEARSGLIAFYLEAPAIMGGDLEKAHQQALEIAKRDPLAGYRERARIHMKQEDWAKAQAVWNEAAVAYPQSVEPLNGLGFYHQQRKEWSDAFAAFRRAQSVDPGDLISLYQIGRTSVLSGQSLDEGASALSRYLTLKPGANQPAAKWAHVRLGQIYEKQKKQDKASAEFKKALALDPEFKEAKEALKSLNQTRSSGA